jgi:uncharacterized membrane protein
MNLSDFKEIAIDGTKIIAHSSKKKSMREPKLDKYIEGIRHDIKVYSEEVEKEDSLDRKQELNQKISECKTKETQLLERKEEIKKRKENLQPKDRENHQINIEEPEALMMSLAQGGYAPGYNGQIAVDNQSRLIVTQELVQDRNDEKQFSRQYEQVENNLGMDKERKYIADGGYSSLSQTEFVKTNDIDAYIADPKLKNYKEESIEVIQQEEKKLNRLDFKYDEENDCYHCPMGESLEFIGTDAVGRSYRSKDCSQCPIKHQCLGKNNTSGQRKILRDHREESAEQMRNKMMTPEGVSMMMLRQTTVEPVFGNIKENLGYRRFRRKGLKNAKGEFALFCLVHNINRLYMLVLFYFIIKIRALKIKNVLERILITPQNKTVVYNRFNEARIQIWELISTLLLDTGYATASGGGVVVHSYFPDESFPSPEQLKNYESVLPGLAKRLVDQVEKQTAHRFEIENKLVSSGIRKSTLGLIFGFLIGSIGIGGGFYLTALGFNVIGIIFSSATLVSIVTAFIYGSQSKKNGIKKYPESVS